MAILNRAEAAVIPAIKKEKLKAKRERKNKLQAKGKVWITDNLIDIRKKIKSSIKSVEWSNPQQEIFGIKLKGYERFDVNDIVNLNAIKYSHGYKNVKEDKNFGNYYRMASYDHDLLDGVKYHKGRFMGKSYHLEFVKLINRFLEDFEFTFDDIEYVDMKVVDGYMEIANGMGATFVSHVKWSSWKDFVSFPKKPMTEKEQEKFNDLRKQLDRSEEKYWYELFDTKPF